MSQHTIMSMWARAPMCPIHNRAMWRWLFDHEWKCDDCEAEAFASKVVKEFERRVSDTQVDEVE